MAGYTIVFRQRGFTTAGGSTNVKSTLGEAWRLRILLGGSWVVIGRATVLLSGKSRGTFFTLLVAIPRFRV